jgi:hypothetical protein
MMAGAQPDTDAALMAHSMTIGRIFFLKFAQHLCCLALVDGRVNAVRALP